MLKLNPINSLGLEGQTFLGVLINPPWPLDATIESPPNLLITFLKSLLSPSLLPSGMVFLWTLKALFPQVFDLMAELGLHYVENLLWVRMLVNNRPSASDSPFFRSSKSVLMVFRRFAKKENLELRHQRSADVVLDFVPPPASWTSECVEPKPMAVHEMIETLLPDAAYKANVGRGQLLEVWSRKDGHRSGWTTLHQVTGIL